MKFKAVKFMREARDRTCKEAKYLSVDEQKKYYEQHSQFLKRLQKDSVVLVETSCQ